MALTAQAACGSSAPEEKVATLIDWILLELSEAGLEEAVFIVGYRGDLVEDHVRARWPELRC